MSIFSCLGGLWCLTFSWLPGNQQRWSYWTQQRNSPAQKKNCRVHILFSCSHHTKSHKYRSKSLLAPDTDLHVNHGFRLPSKYQIILLKTPNLQIKKSHLSLMMRFWKKKSIMSISISLLLWTKQFSSKLLRPLLPPYHNLSSLHTDSLPDRLEYTFGSACHFTSPSSFLLFSLCLYLSRPHPHNLSICPSHPPPWCEHAGQ